MLIGSGNNKQWAIGNGLLPLLTANWAFLPRTFPVATPMASAIYYD
jgi:hypothetical protein